LQDTSQALKNLDLQARGGFLGLVVVWSVVAILSVLIVHDIVNLLGGLGPEFTAVLGGLAIGSQVEERMISVGVHQTHSHGVGHLFTIVSGLLPLKSAAIIEVVWISAESVCCKVRLVLVGEWNPDGLEDIGHPVGHLWKNPLHNAGDIYGTVPDDRQKVRSVLCRWDFITTSIDSGVSLECLLDLMVVASEC